MVNSFTKFDLDRRRPQSHARGPERPTRDLGLRLIDACLGGAVLLVPWCMGGRHPFGELLLVVLAIVAALCTLARQAARPGVAWFRTPAEGIFLAALVLVVVQLIPWSDAILRVLAPHTRDLLPLWSTTVEGGIRLGVWNQVSLTPEATKAGLVVYLAYGLLFFAAVQRMERLEDVERALRWVAIAAGVMAVFGIVQFVTSNDKFLWLYKHPLAHTDLVATGMFTNRNHFAHLLALGIGPVLWCLARSIRRPNSELERLGLRVPAWRKVVWAAALCFVLFAGLLSMSRGGVLVMALAAASCLAAMQARGLLGRSFLHLAAGAGLFLAVSLAIHGYQAVSECIDACTTTSLDNWDASASRRAIWKADSRALADFFVLGSGIGSHREVYPMYLSEQRDTEFTHAENGYLQIALEAGLPGIALLILALVQLGCCCYRCLKQPGTERFFAAAAAISASLVASAAHSLVDFVWYVPGCMVALLVLAAGIFRLDALRADVDQRRALWPAWLPMAAALPLALVGVWMVRDRAFATAAAPHWDAYLHFALSAEGQAGAEPDDSVVEHLRAAAHWTPGDSRVHMRLAAASLRRFDSAQARSECPMPLVQIRDAALASKFESQAALDGWLSRAVGPRRGLLEAAAWHADRALHVCPLAGEAYVYLSQLWFMRSPDASAVPALVSQALAVRPYSGDVLLTAGSEAALLGDFSRAIEMWRRAFHAGPETQTRFIELWSKARMPVAVVLQSFEPDLAAMRRLSDAYGLLDQPEQTQVVLAHYADVAQKSTGEQSSGDAAATWLNLAQAFHRLGDRQGELESLATRTALAPADYNIRWSLGSALMATGQFHEAETHLRRCSQRRPGNANVQQALAAAVKGRIDSDTNAGRVHQGVLR